MIIAQLLKNSLRFNGILSSNNKQLQQTTTSPGSEPEFEKSDGEGSGAGWDVDEDLELPPDLDINVTTVTGGSYNPPGIGTSTAKVCLLFKPFFYLFFIICFSTFYNLFFYFIWSLFFIICFSILILSSIVYIQICAVLHIDMMQSRLTSDKSNF